MSKSVFTSTADEKAPPRRAGPQAIHLSRRAIIIAAILVGLVLLIIITRHIAVGRKLKESEKSAAEVTVEVINAKRDSQPHDLVLPGDFESYQAATLYARINGYIKTWYKDIGAKVNEGDLIAEIAAPDVDAQLNQAQANLFQAQANMDIANLNFERQKDLLIKKVVSQQDFDTARTSLEAQQGAVKAGDANVQNLKAQQGFEKIVAPFNGTVTRRSIDVGDLVSAGSSTAGTMLFELQQSDPLRIYVYVPQSDAPNIRVGMQAKILVGEYPGRDFEGAVVRTAGAVDPASRTLLTEVDIANPDNALYAGIYGQVEFRMLEKSPPILVPANVFRFRAAGPQVASIINGNHLHWLDVKVGRDYGTKIELVSGVEENTPLVSNPTDDLQEGMQVTVKQKQEQQASDKSGQQAPSVQPGEQPAANQQSQSGGKQDGGSQGGK